MSHYVVYYCERLRDGIEESSVIVRSIEDGLKIINKWQDGFGSQNQEYRMFELGKEIPLGLKEVREPQPAKMKTIYFVDLPDDPSKRVIP